MLDPVECPVDVVPPPPLFLYIPQCAKAAFHPVTDGYPFHPSKCIEPVNARHMLAYIRSLRVLIYSPRHLPPFPSYTQKEMHTRIYER